MRTDPRQLHGEAFDVVVIGADIQGAAITRDAAMRGLRALLVDAGDVSAAASPFSNHLAHGGVGCLRPVQLSLLRRSLEERERLLRMAPHLVRPQPMLAPLYDGAAPSAWRQRLGAWLYGKAARRATLPRPRQLSVRQAIAAFPGLRAEGLRGAIELFDARTQDARLTLANVRDAVAQGAALCSHASVVGSGPDGLRLVSEGVEVEVRCCAVFNAAGAMVDSVRRALGVQADRLVRPVRTRHVVLSARAGELALCAILPDARNQFVIPHDGGTLCGPMDVAEDVDGLEAAPLGADLDDLGGAFSCLLDPVPARAELQFAFVGRRALPNIAARAGAQRGDGFVVEEAIGCGRLHNVVGGGFLMHRALAEHAVAAAFGQARSSPTRRRPLPGGVGPREVEDPLWWRHGGLVADVRALASGGLGELLCAHRPFLACELVYAVQSEGAWTFADAMLRRLVDVRGPCLERACIERALGVFERAGGRVVDAASSVAELREEVKRVTGDFEAWQQEQS